MNYANCAFLTALISAIIPLYACAQGDRDSICMLEFNSRPDAVEAMLIEYADERNMETDVQTLRGLPSLVMGLRNEEVDIYAQNSFQIDVFAISVFERSGNSGKLECELLRERLERNGLSVVERNDWPS